MPLHPTDYRIADAPTRRPTVYDHFGVTREEAFRIAPVMVVGAFLGVVGARFAFDFANPVLATAFPALVALVSALAAGLLTLGVIRGTARLVAGAVLPSGHTTPAVADFSRADALLMRRDVAGAMRLFEEAIALAPEGAAARLRAADLCAGAGADPHRAAALYREVQRLPDVAPTDEVYASNRLVDLYLGPLADTGRAVVELRRLITRHPGTRAAAEAARGLATLKARLLAERAADGGEPDGIP